MPEMIDREQAGKNICKYCASSAYCKEDDCMVYQGLRDTPTIQIEAEPVRHGRWIPCSERMPEQGERVIVAIFGSDMIMPNEGETLQDAIERSRKEGYITVGFIGSDGWYGADWFPLMVQPSYWMPKPDLPEPPKE